jgi:hypothetical protein
VKPKYAVLIAACFASAAFSAPKVENVTVDPSQPKFSGDKPPEVEVSVNVSRTKFDKGGCDARVEFGDGEGRTLDFEVASKRNVKHTYKKGGSYTVVAKGTGKRPCDGMAQMPVVVQGPPPPKPAAKPAPKKAEPKKAEKKAPAKKAPAKKSDDKKKAPAKKAPAKKDEKKKDDTSK